MAESYSGDFHNLRPTGVVKEFEKTLLDELDLMREAANASQLRRNFTDSHILYVPQVEWEYTRHDVMVMERIQGIPINDFQALRDADINFQWLAEAGVEVFFTQVFRGQFTFTQICTQEIFL